jgi:Ca2+-binding RTX toxin-like protein
VRSSISFGLAANVENLTLIGVDAINGTGNALNNRLVGNDQANLLEAGDGNDVLVGNAGNDTLDGGAGNDVYVFGRGDDVDTIAQSDGGSTNDRVRFGEDIARDQLWFVRDGDDLRVSIVGTDDEVVLNSWYLGEPFQVDKFVTSTGDVLLDSQVDALVSAMASFSPPSVGQLTLTDEQHAALDGVIAANWQ